eukprot:757725-Amphidinium_carterae.1
MDDKSYRQEFSANDICTELAFEPLLDMGTTSFEHLGSLQQFNVIWLVTDMLGALFGIVPLCLPPLTITECRRSSVSCKEVQEC